MINQESFILKVMYDPEFDILTLKYGGNDNATAKELGPNIIIYTDDVTGETTTVTIMDFVRCFDELEPSLENIPFKINLYDILQRIA